MKLQFSHYNGKQPNLCGGTLVFTLDEQPIEFPAHCLYTTGEIVIDRHGKKKVVKGPWTIREFPSGFPEELEKQAVDLVNEHIKLGCCGGCIQQSEKGEI